MRTEPPPPWPTTRSPGSPLCSGGRGRDGDQAGGECLRAPGPDRRPVDGDGRRPRPCVRGGRGDPQVLASLPVPGSFLGAAVGVARDDHPGRFPVLLLTGAATHDEREYPDPDRFDITRASGHALGFGFGIHTCLGAALARMESRVALQEMIRRWPVSLWTRADCAGSRWPTSPATRRSGARRLRGRVAGSPRDPSGGARGCGAGGRAGVRPVLGLVGFLHGRSGDVLRSCNGVHACAVHGRPADDPQSGRRRRPRAGDLSEGVPGVRQLRTGHQSQGLALPDPHQHLHQHLPGQETAPRDRRRRGRGGPVPLPPPGW